MVKYLIVLAVMFLYSPWLLAFNETGIALSDGRPVDDKVIDTSTLDLSVRHNFWTLGDDFAAVGLSARFGQMKVDDESAFRTGLGTYIAKDFGWVSFSIPVGVVWLDKNVFDAHQHYIKDYGGQVQFTYGAEMAFNFTNQWQFFYRFEHMSNADRYDYNPALDSHNVGLRINF